MAVNEYDVIVLGAGPVGENLAERTASAGLATVIVEGELIGGECSYWACMPSKALLRPAAALRAARDVRGAAEAVTGGVDVEAALARRDTATSEYDDSGQVAWLESAGIALVRGHGRLDGPRRVRVEHADGTASVLTARRAVAVATGSGALIPDIPGLAESRPWTNREATCVERIPERLAILGGGVVGSEMATAYSSLGASVTVIARSGLLGGVEPFAADAVRDALVATGVDIRTGTTATRVRRGDDGAVTLELEGGGEVVADEVLVATGRTPNTDDIGLETVELEPGSWLDVDDTMLVRGTDWLYAAGDVTHRALLTHQGKYQARAAGDAIAALAHGDALDTAPWGVHVATADHHAVPQVSFTDPEIASVGYTAAEAEAEGRSVRVLDYDLASVAGSTSYSDDYRGHARAIVDTTTETLIGATFVGPDVAELLQAATIAIVGEVPLARLWHAVPAYPTVSEVWLRLLEEYGRPTA